VAYKLQKHFSDFELTVYEKNPDISGTWFENRYPGCACDIPSHCYTWSFEPKTDWSANYASSQEIYQYFSDFADKYNLRQYIKLNHPVIGATWKADQAQWEVQVKNDENGEVMSTSCHILINAGGILNAWRYPPIPGLLDQYKGTLCHSAAWPENLDYEGKVLGLIGNGSSGIQILPNTAPKVRKLKTFIREATWVSPPIGQTFQVYSDEDKARFATDADHHLDVRKQIERGMNNQFSVFHAGSIAQQYARDHMLGEMKRKLKNEKLENLLIPEWSVGCRRVTPGPNYLESLSRDNVEVIFGEITRITEKGPVTEDGTEHPVDILVCATGFDTTFKPRFPLVGTTGEELAKVWKDEPKAYLGMATPNYPNYFMTLGPNCPIGNGPVLIAIEAEVDYFIKVLTRFQKENLRSFDVRPEPVEDFIQWKDDFMKKTIWNDECRSWYKAGTAEGKVAALWPGSTLHYLEAIRDVRWEDFKIEHEAGHNRWEFLGNGHSSAEKRTGDLAYYIRNHDDAHVDPCVNRKLYLEDASSENVPRGIVPSLDDLSQKHTTETKVGNSHAITETDAKHVNGTSAVATA
jgi:cyclohexanone monooxygenase